MFGARLRQARVDKNMTLDELAERYNRQFGGGLNKSTLSKYENDKQEPMLTTIRQLALVLEVTESYLIGTQDKNRRNIDKDTEEILEAIFNRPELRILFSTSKTATKEDIIKANEIIKVLKDK